MLRVYLVIKKLEAVAQRCSVKKVFLEISQNSQENTCARVSFLIKLQAWPATFLTEHLWWLLLRILLLTAAVYVFWCIQIGV